MQTNQNKTALLLFSRSPEKERSFKHFSENHSYNSRIHKLLYENTLELAKQSGYPLIIIDEQKQSGSRFGQRISNAIDQVFSLGYERVLTIGSDCIDLSTQDLQACEALSIAHGVAIGPTHEGGVYLIGLDRRSFDKSLFANLPWQTKGLLSAIQDVFCLKAKQLLARKIDANGTISLRVALNTCKWNVHLTAVYQLLCLSDRGSGTSTGVDEKIARTYYGFNLQGRAPPSFV